jgi:hypothetical protein
MCLMINDPDETARLHHRAELTPEELSAGSDDPQAQAAAILSESDERVAHPEEGARESTQSATHAAP